MVNRVVAQNCPLHRTIRKPPFVSMQEIDRHAARTRRFLDQHFGRPI